MEKVSASLTLCEENPLVDYKVPLMGSFAGFFVITQSDEARC